MEKLKQEPMTFGRLATIVVMIATISSGAIALARFGDVSRHEDRAIEKAHPEIKERFVSKRELTGSLNHIKNRLTAIETILRERLPLRKKGR